MRPTLIVAWSILFVLIGLSACNEPDLVGSDIIEDDVIQVKNSDTFTVQMHNIPGDDIEVFDRPGLEPDRVLCGRIVDDIFGLTDHSFYMQLRPPLTVPDREGAIVDSVVLLLEYDSTWFYGPTDVSHSVDVFRVVERMDENGEYFQNTEFMTEAQPVGSRSGFDPRPSTNVNVRIPGSGDTLVLPPHLRIRLDNQLGEEILAFDSLVLEDDTLFFDQFSGLYIKPSSDAGEVMAFNPRIVNPLSQTARVSGLSIFYHYLSDTSTILEEYRMTVTGAALVQHTEMNYSGSLAAEMLAAPPGGDSILFLQGLQGLEIDVEFPYLEEWDNVLINHAELDIGIYEPPGYDYDIYPPAGWIRTAEVVSVDMLRNTDEFGFELARGIPGFFGGTPMNEVQDTSVVKLNLTLNLTQHIQKIIDGDATETIRLIIQPKLNNPERVIILGPESKRKPAELRITYTENQ